MIAAAAKNPFRRVVSYQGTPQTFGQRILARRWELGLKMREVEAAVGVSHSFLWTVETDRALPNVSVAAKFSKVLRCSLDWLVFGKGARR